MIPFETEAESATVCHELAFVDGDSDGFGIVDWLLRSAPTAGEAEEGKRCKFKEKGGRLDGTGVRRVGRVGGIGSGCRDGCEGG